MRFKPSSSARRSRIAVAAALLCAAGLFVGGLGAAQAAPDLSGVWMGPFKVHASGMPMTEGATAWTPASKGDPALQKLPTLAEMSAAIDALVKANNGVPRGNGPPPSMPFTPAGKAAFDAVDHKKLLKQELTCFPTNLMSRIGAGPVQIVQNPKFIAFINEGGTPGMTVFLDGRGHADALPQWNGHSVGRWDGDVLVIETVKVRGDLFGAAGYPISEDAKITQRIALSPDGKQLLINATLEDPVNYTEPLRKFVRLNARPDLEVLDYNCLEGLEDSIASPD